MILQTSPEWNLSLSNLIIIVLNTIFMVFNAGQVYANIKTLKENQRELQGKFSEKMKDLKEDFDKRITRIEDFMDNWVHKVAPPINGGRRNYDRT